MPRQFNDLDALEPGQKAFGARKIGLVNNQVSMGQKDAGPVDEPVRGRSTMRKQFNDWRLRTGHKKNWPKWMRGGGPDMSSK